MATDTVEAIVAEMRLAHSVTMRQLADRLQSAHDAEVRDARRYRWLRAEGMCPFAETDDAWDSPESLDAAIDRAMEGEDG